MQSFKELLTESILLSDTRKNKHEPFHVLTNGPMIAKNGYRTVPKYMALTPADNKGAHVAFPGETQSRYFSGAAFTVHPNEKKVVFNIDNENQYNNRRPNIKLSPTANFGSAKKGTPVLDIGNDLTHSQKAVFKDLHKHVENNFSEYTVHNHGTIPDGTKIADILKMHTPNEQWVKGQEPLTFYHGTSSKKAAIIQQHGLQPAKRAEHEQYGDLIKGYSEHNVYLTTTPSEASNYATREAIHDKSDPVVLKVKVHPKDFGKLIHDEDNLKTYESNPEHLRKQFETKHPQLFNNSEGIIPGLHYGWLNHTDPTKHGIGLLATHPGIPAGRDSDEYQHEAYKDLMKVFHSPLSHLRDTVAFKGSIKPEHIQQHSTWSIKDTAIKMDSSTDEYNEAHKKQRATFKRNVVENWLKKI